MGCNSHTYVEIRRKGKEDWVSLFYYEVDRRNYDLYAKMADVRNYSGIIPIAPMRGFPDQAGYFAERAYYQWIDDKIKGDAFISSRAAEKKVAAGYAHYSPDKKRVSCGNWHSPSWLTGEEFCTAVHEVAADDIYWMAVAAAVEHVNNHPDFECRVVFWFDN